MDYCKNNMNSWLTAFVSYPQISDKKKYGELEDYRSYTNRDPSLVGIDVYENMKWSKFTSLFLQQDTVCALRMSKNSQVVKGNHREEAV